MDSMQTNSLVGEYAVEGKNELGDLYEGKATISSKGSGRYLISWDLGDEELLIHEAYVKGNNLHIDFYAAVYEIRNDGTLEGKWGAAGNYEKLTPYMLVRASSTGAGETHVPAAQDAVLATPPAGQVNVETGKLDGQLIGALQVALLDSFTLDTMRHMTRIYLDEALEDIAGGSDFSGVTFNLIDWAERNGRLLDLLNGAITAVPGNANLKDCAASLRPYLA
jgi:hypothetical protein